MYQYTEKELINEAYSIGLAKDDINEHYSPYTPLIYNPDPNYSSNTLDTFQLGKLIAIHRINNKIYSSMADLLKIKFMLGFVIKDDEELTLDHTPLSLQSDRAKDLILFLEDYVLKSNKLFFDTMCRKCIGKE